jgi:hypothetical protein
MIQLEINLEPISANFGKTDDGLDFKDFLGEEQYETHIIAPFDDFLFESFSKHRLGNSEYSRLTNLQTGPDVCKSRACGTPVSKEGSPEADEKDNDDIEYFGEDNSDAASRGAGSKKEKQKNIVEYFGEDNSSKKEKQKSIITAVLGRFHR